MTEKSTFVSLEFNKGQLLLLLLNHPVVLQSDLSDALLNFVTLSGYFV